MITKTQKQIIELLKEEGSTKRVALRRRTSIRAVQKIVKRLKEKGIISGSSYRGFVFNVPEKDFIKKVRLHGQEFNLKLKFKGTKFPIHQKTFIFEGNKVRLYKKSIEIYSKKSFYANTPYEARAKSINYFKAFFFKLQDHLDIQFKQIKQVKSHYAEEENELAQDYNNKKQKLSIRAKEDNKTWAMIDFSLNENEFETLHPKTSFEDMEKVKEFFQDIRDNPHYKPSVSTKLIIGIANNQQMFNDNLVKHFVVLDKIAETMESIRDLVKKNRKI